MKIILYKKGLVLVIIMLFVGVAIAPGIIASVNLSDITLPRISNNEIPNNDLVEITIQLGNTDHKVMLTLDQAMELEILIDSTKTRLDMATTIEETSIIFNDTVVSLYELGMLPEDMGIEEAQRLVNGMNQNPKFVKKLEQWFNRNQENLDDDQNFLCLISGYTDNTFISGTIGLISLFLLAKLCLFLTDTINLPLLSQLMFMILGASEIFLFFFWLLNPIPFLYTISFGEARGLFFIPAHGWIHTGGLNGLKNWNGSFFGEVDGFTGIKIFYSPDIYFYMGAALWVKID